MRNISLVFRRIVRPVSVALVLLLVVSSLQAQDAKEGETIFKANCSSCHKVFGKFLGPELAGVNERHDEAWLLKWIHNAPAMIASGDPAALELDAQYPAAAMTAFPQLQEGQIKSILAYIKSEEEKKAAGDAAGGATGSGNGAAAAASGDASNFMIIGLVAVIALAFVVILVLNRVIRTLERVIANSKDLIPEPELTEKEGKDYLGKLKKLAKNKKLVFFAVLMLVVFLGSAGWKTLWNVGVHEGYQPVQPIKFSHQLHAGVNQIECQYCHGGAFKSKNASIPSANVCMNCHKAITASDKYDGELSPEIAKIYRALDYNPETMEYGPNQRPIEWVRIHNLPDFAYFNHSQHVVVAGVECQTCHGPIETMAEVYQYSPLTMKWCVDCHQKTEVNHQGNAYYDQLIAAHEKLKKGEKVTAAMLGGLECGKCHY
ncbi:cytochrome c [Parapedobacter defluvii]|uniref:Cytochrome c n=1 Tax=Parapedobacter defluvii TaxID=2045106 RepID=A0ABQ1L098_9SPHI|nr:c-type cytochrome [Parapedobacter defluvii]RQP19133.1 MAG: cytochrome C [Parapedobacter sp.]GGC16111.1 cytochrome c [Parapedobacter defluvii]